MDSIEGLKSLTFVTRSSFCFIGFYLIYQTYRLWINGNRYQKPMDSVNKVVIITGASKGIGKEIALNFARRGSHIIMACHDMKTGYGTQNEIIEKTGNPNVKCMHLNLGSFKSIRIFANEFLKTGSPLNILINNASILRLKRNVTEDGLEQTIGINYFGHYLLTMLLMKRLSETKRSRIINISNWIHRCVQIDRMDMMCERQYCGYLAYARSQLAIILFTLAISERLKNTGIICNVIHPGISLSRFFKNVDDPMPFYMPKWLLIFLMDILCKSDEVCAEGFAYAAFDFSIQTINGLYISNAQIGRIGENTNDAEITEWLWRYSMGLTGEKMIKLTTIDKQAT